MLSSSESPMLILPPAPALKYALPSTLRSPCMCTFCVNVVGVSICVIPDPTTMKSPVVVSICVWFNCVKPDTDIVLAVICPGISNAPLKITVLLNNAGVLNIVSFEPLNMIGDSSEDAVND